jgi:hypothetical protein
MSRYGAHLCLATLVLTLAGCGGSGDAATERAADNGTLAGGDAGARSAAPAATNPAPELLTTGEVALIGRFPEVRLVPRDPSRGAGGDLNFEGPDGQLVLLVVRQPASAYDQNRDRHMAEEVAGVGDAAWIGPRSGPRNMLFVRVGDRAAALSSFLDLSRPGGPAPYLGEAQLQELGRLVADRL